MTRSKQVQIVKLRQYLWYQPREVEFALPASWRVEICNIAGYNQPAMRPEEIKAALAFPIGAPSIRELARGKKEVVILFDDMSRSTPVSLIAPFIIDELKAAGVADERIRFIAAIGTHGALNRDNLSKKLGDEIVARFPVYNHSPFMNCTYVGTTSLGLKAYVNAEVIACDLKIGIGQITPHLMAGFSGGGKIIMPGVSSYETIEAHHKNWRSSGAAMGTLEGNRMSTEIQEIAGMAGLDIKIDCIVNAKGEPVAIFAGSPAPAYRAGAELARTHYMAPVTLNNDIVIANSFIKASEGLVAVHNAYPAVRREGGDVVILANAPCGQAILYLLHSWGKTIGGSLYHPNQIPKHINHLFIYTEYPEATILDSFVDRERVIISTKWSDVVNKLEELHGSEAKVAVLPSADIQYSQH